MKPTLKLLSEFWMSILKAALNHKCTRLLLEKGITHFGWYALETTGQTVSSISRAAALRSLTNRETQTR